MNATPVVTMQSIVEEKIPKYDNITGPFTDPFNGLEYYVGELEGMLIKFNIKSVEYGKIRKVQKE